MMKNTGLTLEAAVSLDDRAIVASNKIGALTYPPSESKIRSRGWWRRSVVSKGVLYGVTVAAVLSFLTSIYNFLAVNSPVGQGTLVVEAWISQRALSESLHLFNSGHYTHLVVVGGPIQGTGNESTPPTTWADVAAKKLERLGLDPERLVRIGVPPVEEGRRTLTSATAVRRWLDRSDSPFLVDIFTAGVHARKSWTLFRYALGDRYRVGIIAGPEDTYDRRFWFLSTTGIWYVVRDMASYLYSRVWILFNTQGLATLAKPKTWPPDDTFTILGNLSPASINRFNFLLLIANRALMRAFSRSLGSAIGSQYYAIGVSVFLHYQMQGVSDSRLRITRPHSLFLKSSD